MFQFISIIFAILQKLCKVLKLTRKLRWNGLIHMYRSTVCTRYFRLLSTKKRISAILNEKFLLKTIQKKTRKVNSKE